MPIERTADVGRVLEALGRARVVSLWGAPGVGKSVVAEQIATAWESRGGEVLRATGRKRRAAKTGTLVVTDATGADDPEVASIASAHPAAHVLAVSRRRQRDALSAIELGPLGVPPAGADGKDAPSVALFLTLARDAGVPLDAADPSLVRLARALDGVPLALVHAARRLELLGLAGLVARVERSPRELLEAPVRSAIAASWATLSAPERTALAQLSLFGGPFSSDALEAVVRELTEDPLATIAALRDSGLLARNGSNGEAPSFSLLSVVRAFGREELRQGGSTPAAERAHAVALATLAPDALARVRLDELDRAIDAYADEDATRARLLGARGRAWSNHGAQTDALADFARALAIAPDGDTSVRPDLLVDAGVAHHLERDMESARRCYAEALAAFRGSRDRRGEGRVVANLGAMAHDLGELDEALAHYRQALALFSAFGEDRLAAITLSNLGVLEQEWAMTGEARQHLERAIVLSGRAGDVRFEGITRGNLGSLLAELGARGEARAALEAALALARAAGDARTEALCLGRLGGVMAADGEIAEARRALDDADAIAHRTDDEVARTTVHVHRAFLDLALARLARSEGHTEKASAHARDARARATIGAAGPSPTELPDDARTALRMLMPLLDPEAERDDELVIGPNATTFRIRGGAVQSLVQRRPLRGMFALLVERHEQRGEPATVDDLRAAGWPGERMAHSAAVNRVQVAIAELRKRGLKGDLVREGDGYRLVLSLQVRKEAG